jgi:hypothetical protein
MGLTKMIEYLHITLYIVVYDRISAKVSPGELKTKTLLVSYKYLNIEKHLWVIGKYLRTIIIIIRKIKYIWYFWDVYLGSAGVLYGLTLTLPFLVYLSFTDLNQQACCLLFLFPLSLYV